MKSILLVDDEQQSVDVFKATLIAGGNAVDNAKDAKTALELCKNKQYDLIILDEMMPDMSGNELIKIIKQNEKNAETPIIILTNYSEDKLVKSALEAGAQDYILKYKMIPEDLLAKVREIIGE